MKLQRQKRGTNQPRRGNMKKPVKNSQVPTLTDRILSSGNMDVIPTRKLVWLNYIDSTLVRNNAGFDYLTFNMRANSAYDPDPLLLSGGISGFSEYAKFYSFYRVLEIELSWAVSNKESFPVHLGLTASTNSLLINSVATAIDTLENGYSLGPATISPSGGMDRVMITKRISLSKVWGSVAQYLADDNWASSVTTNPIFLVNLAFVAYASSPFMNGIDSDLRIRFHTEFFLEFNYKGNRAILRI
jgi:hypothetical protein